MPITLKKRGKSKTIKGKKGGNGSGNKRTRSRSSSNGSSKKKRILTPEQKELKDLVIENIKNKKNYWMYDAENDEYIDFVNINKFNKKGNKELKEQQIKEQETKLLNFLHEKNYDIKKILKSKTMDLFGYYKDDENKNYYKVIGFEKDNLGRLLILLEKGNVEDADNTDDEKSDSSIHSDSYGH